MSFSRVLIVNHDFPPNALAGAEVLTYNHAKSLNNAGYDVSVFTATTNKDQAGWQEYEGIRVYRVYSNVHERWRAYINIYHPIVVKHFRKVLEETKPDIIHFHNVHGQLTYYLFKMAFQQTRQIFMTGHDVMTFAYGKISYFIDRPRLPNGDYNYRLPWLYNLRYAKKRYNPLRNIIIRHYLKYVKKILCDSHELAKALNQNGIIQAVGYNSCINVADWMADKQKVENYKKQFKLGGKGVILFVSRLTENKGRSAILKVMSQVVKQQPNAKLVLVGERSNKTADMNQSNIEDNIIFTGRIPHEEIKNVFNMCDIAVTPSVYLDPFPTVNLEAMACGKPVVGTSFGGTPEAVQDGKTGFIVNPHDTKIFAEKLIYLLQNPDQAKKMGQAGLSLVREKFNSELWLKSMLDYYEN